MVGAIIWARCTSAVLAHPASGTRANAGLAIANPVPRAVLGAWLFTAIRPSKPSETLALMTVGVACASFGATVGTSEHRAVIPRKAAFTQAIALTTLAMPCACIRALLDLAVGPNPAIVAAASPVETIAVSTVGTTLQLACVATPSIVTNTSSRPSRIAFSIDTRGKASLDLTLGATEPRIALAGSVHTIPLFPAVRWAHPN